MNLTKERFKFYLEKAKKLYQEQLDSDPFEKEWATNSYIRENADKIFFANAHAKAARHKNFIVPYIEAACEIPEGSQIGFSYGNSYFDKLGIQIKYFNKNGTLT